MLTLIVAASENDSIGKDNELLWHLPKDFKRFKQLTSNYPIIMGRKTFDSLPGVLPNRPHIIITRQKNLIIKNCTVVSSLNEAIKTSNTIHEHAFIIGGGEIYTQSLEIADRIEITRVHTKIEGDTFFPKIDFQKWQLVFEEFHKKDEKHKFNFSFLTYNRKTNNFSHLK